MEILDNILQAIGNTPLVQMPRLTAGLRVTVVATSAVLQTQRVPFS